jgi:hypothetical protein
MLEYYLMLKIIDLLTKPWTELPAYKLGIIDANGKVLKNTHQLKTATEKVAYGTFQKFCFNLRRFIEKLPGGKTKLAKYLTVYALFKESEDSTMDSMFSEEFGTININEAFEQDLLKSKAILHRGTYRLVNDMLDSNGKLVKRETLVTVSMDQKTQMVLFGKPVFEVYIPDRGKNMVVSLDDISDDV